MPRKKLKSKSNVERRVNAFSETVYLLLVNMIQIKYLKIVPLVLEFCCRIGKFSVFIDDDILTIV